MTGALRGIELRGIELRVIELRVIAPGARTLVQDRGFRDARSMGVPAGGVLDVTALRLVNALLGNPAGTEALEFVLSAPRLRAEGGLVWVATCAGLGGRVRSPDGAERPVPEWTATCLNDGDELHLAPPPRGAVGVLGIGGGLDVPMVLDSRSTCEKAMFGGFQGRSLAQGDRLLLRGPATAPGPDRRFRTSLRADSGPIRVVPGPQPENFTAAAYATFFGTGYRITPRMDRMGMRLDGARLEHSGPKAADIISDGAAPGAIQVPGNGQPIILLADAQTTGGYPKIATVIRADLPRLAACVPGDLLHFARVTVAEGEAAARAQDRHLAEVSASRTDTQTTAPDAQALLGVNLISGMIDMARPDHFPGHLGPPDGKAPPR